MPRGKANVVAPVDNGSSILDAIDSEQEATLSDLSQEPVQPVSEKGFTPVEATMSVSDMVAQPSKRAAVILKPIGQGNFRLGLEQTPEKFLTMPGTTQRWAPKKVGNNYRTGLNRVELAPTPEERAVRIKELEDHFGKKLDNDFYADMSFRIDNNKPLGEKLFLDDPWHLVVYLAMLESDNVANGIQEYKSGEKPFALWYIEDKEAEAEEKAKLRSDKQKASRLFDSLSFIKKRKVAIVVGLSVLGLSDLATENVLWDWIEGSAANARTFVSVVERGDTYINISELVKHALRFHVLRTVNTGDIYYGDSLIGTTEEQIVQKLMSTQYSDLRLGIQTKVEAKFNQI